MSKPEKALIDVPYAEQFLRTVSLSGAAPEVLELHIVACRLLDQLQRERKAFRAALAERARQADIQAHDERINGEMEQPAEG